MKLLEEALAEKRQQMQKLQIEMATIESLIRRHNGEPAVVEFSGRRRRSNVKGMLLDMLKEVGPGGLNAAKAVEISEQRGEPLERNTVSSLLSRLKADGVVTYDGTFYRLTEFMPSKPSLEPKQSAEAVSGPNASKGIFG